MKKKNKILFVTLTVLVALLIYNIFCYKFVNKTIKNGTVGVISEIIGSDYEYVRATLNQDNTINVYVMNNKEYYNFIVAKNGNNYNLLYISEDIPAYIEKEWLFI